MDQPCVHSCKGLCRALAIAEQNVRQGLADYRRYAEGCDYPDVRNLLQELASEHERMLGHLEDTKQILEERFRTIDDIRESFV